MSDIYLGKKKVKEWGQPEMEDEKHPQIWVVYEDGTKDVMHEDEWACRTEAPTMDKQDLFVKSTQGMQKEILSLISQHNLKFEDIGRLFDWVVEKVNQNKDAALSASLHVKDWRQEATLDSLQLDTDKLGDMEKAILATLVGQNAKLFDVILGTAWRNILEAIKTALDKTLEGAMDCPLDEARIDNINQLAEQTYALSNAENAENVEDSGPGGEEVVPSQDPQPSAGEVPADGGQDGGSGLEGQQQ